MPRTDIDGRHMDRCRALAEEAGQAGVRRVVIGERTPDIGGVTSAHPILVAADVSRWSAPPVIVWWGD